MDVPDSRTEPNQSLDSTRPDDSVNSDSDGVKSIKEFYGKQYDSMLNIIKRMKKEKSYRRDSRSLSEFLENTSRRESIDQGSILKLTAIYPTFLRADQEKIPLKHKSDSLYKLMESHLKSKTSLQTKSKNNPQPTTEQNPLPTNENVNQVVSPSLPVPVIPNAEMPESKKDEKNQQVVLISDFWVLEDGCIPKSSCPDRPEGALDGKLLMDNLVELKNEICK